MILRSRNYPHLRKTLALGTSLTALFLLVRCAVPERDYSKLGIDGNAGSGGTSGAGSGGNAGSSAGAGQGGGGVDGLGGQSGGGGQAGAPPLPPVPCDEDERDAGTADAGASDAGASDAGTTDAGTSASNPDAGATDTTCACVDGFIQAVDTDGDGVGTRACELAPGLDCDDDDPAITHNACGGCSALPNAIGDACLDCGTYACGGPDTLVCAALPGPVEDPDCRCVDGLITARDTDADGEGTRLCEQNPGADCNDGDSAYITNACGGCAELPAAVGDACNQCGVYACNGTALACVPSTGAAGRRCLNATTRQTCVGTGFWAGDTACDNVCYAGNCEACTPGTFQCVDIGGGSTQIERCNESTSSLGIGWSSYASCSPSTTCNPNNGTCTGQLLLPRDRDFDVAPARPGALPWHDILDTAGDADYG